MVGYNFFMVDLSLICRKIYNAAYLVAGKKLGGSPVAYIHVKAGLKLPFSVTDLSKVFDKLKWDTPLSTADLNVVCDEGVADNELNITGVEEFFDDSGKADVYPVSEDDAVITF